VIARAFVGHVGKEIHHAGNKNKQNTNVARSARGHCRCYAALHPVPQVSAAGTVQKVVAATAGKKTRVEVPQA